MRREAARSHRIGLLCLLVTATSWGLNWPVMKFVLTEVPPMTSRAWSGLAGALFAFLLAWQRRERLRPPPGAMPRLVLFAFLNFTTWMGLATYSLLWLPASEAATYAYSMPIWASAMAWPLLGERPSPLRAAGLLVGVLGVAVLVAGQGVGASWAKLPGILCVLGAALLFALGTVLSKRYPTPMPPVAGVAWQVLLGTVPLAAAALLAEHADLSRLTPGGWAGLSYNAVFTLCLAYLAWFAALRRLPAAVTAMGTLLVPVIGVFASALALGEPLGWRQVAALALTLAGVALAARG